MGMHLDEDLIFEHQINEKINKTNKGITNIRKLSNFFLDPLY